MRLLWTACIGRVDTHRRLFRRATGGLVAVEQRQHAQVLRAARLTAANRLPLPDERFPQRFSCDSRRATRACKTVGGYVRCATRY